MRTAGRKRAYIGLFAAACLAIAWLWGMSVRQPAVLAMSAAAGGEKVNAAEAAFLPNGEESPADQAIASVQALGPEDASERNGSFADRAARVLTHPVVTSALLLLGMIGLVVELLVPGFGIPGTAGALSFFLYFLGHFLTGDAGWFHVGLFLLGILLIALELFVPGGLIGALGFVSMGTGLVLAASETAQGLLSLAFAVIVTTGVAIVLVKRYGARGVWSRLVLKDEQRAEAGYVAPQHPPDLVGKQGTALTPLRPAGIVRIEGKRIDAVSAGSFIAAGTPVTVVEVEGARVVVQERDFTEKEPI